MILERVLLLSKWPLFMERPLPITWLPLPLFSATTASMVRFPDTSFFRADALAMQSILGNMAENGGIPEPIKAQAADLQAAEKLDGGA